MRYSCLLIVSLFFSQIGWGKNEKAYETVDVVIIGAGVSGTYLGWRLVENGRSSVQIFDATNRVGGRLYTIRLEGMPTVPIELGGMQYRSSDRRVASLLHYLGLSTEPFAKPGSNNFLYLRGKRYREDEFKNATDLPYILAEHEKGKSPDELIMMATQALDSKETYRGQSLYDVSWHNFLMEHLSMEAFQLLVDLGYIQMVADVSVGTALPSLTLGSDPSMVISSGYDQLPKEMAKRFQDKGGELYLSHRLMTISYEGKDEDFRYRLIFYTHDGSFKSVFAKHLILTISPPALKLLASQSPALQNQELQDKLAFFIANPLTKLFLAYPTAWWKELGVTSGCSKTTLPIQSCVYFGSKSETIMGEEKGNTNACILASSQALYTPFWNSLNSTQPFSTGVAPLGVDAKWQADKQLKVLHGVDNIAAPYTGAFIDWMEPPFYGAQFYWKVGAHPKEIMEFMMHPLVGERLYIVGSAYSAQQDCVEDALQMAETLLKSYFLLPKASWLD
ncbi:MAG: flavin monoamine oxidase family protein [Chlamydiales bacterium]